jgi:peptidoglycan hydrolase FlgJ
MPSISPMRTAMNSLQSAADARESAASQFLDQSSGSNTKPTNAKLHSTFQDFAAGTFYKEMMKSLRKMHNKPAYVYGGQAEEIFQGQMSQHVAEDLAHSNGGQFASPLLKGFMSHAAST